MLAERRTIARRALLGWLALLCMSALAARLNRPPLRTPSADELARLRQENRLLARELEELRRLEAIRQHWAEELGGFRPLAARLLPAAALDPASHVVRIDLGREDGVRPGQGVIADTGLVGRIGRVHRRTAWVQLVDDPAFRVAFRLGAGRGILAGGPALGEMRPALLGDPLRFEPGQVLVTAGGDGVFPPEIIIGEVREAALPPTSSRVKCAALPPVPEVLLVLTASPDGDGERLPAIRSWRETREAGRSVPAGG